MVDQSATPVQHSPHRVPVALQKDVKKKIVELEEKGIIKKAVEPSEWISGMVVVAKPQKIRICLDPKDLNRAIQRPKFQMPTLEELLPETQECCPLTGTSQTSEPETEQVKSQAAASTS